MTIERANITDENIELARTQENVWGENEFAEAGNTFGLEPAEARQIFRRADSDNNGVIEGQAEFDAAAKELTEAGARKAGTEVTPEDIAGTKNMLVGFAQGWTDTVNSYDQADTSDNSVLSSSEPGAEAEFDQRAREAVVNGSAAVVWETNDGTFHYAEVPLTEVFTAKALRALIAEHGPLDEVESATQYYGYDSDTDLDEVHVDPLEI